LLLEKVGGERKKTVRGEVLITIEIGGTEVR
jgi:hypothetical protein